MSERYKNNSLFSRLNALGIPNIVPIKPDAKAPDILDWAAHTTSLQDITTWDGWPQHGVGVLNEYFPAIDIDVSDSQMVQAIHDVVVSILGRSPWRMGRHPRIALIFQLRPGETWTPHKIKFTFNGEKQEVELRGTGQQTVLLGAYHRDPNNQKEKTLPPWYIWEGMSKGTAWWQNGATRHPFPLVSARDLKKCSDEIVGLLSQHLGVGDISVAGKPVGTSNAGPGTGDGRYGVVAQTSDAELLVRDLFGRLPAEDDYHEWIRIGHALKAAVDEEGLEPWIDWSLKWGTGNRDPEQVWSGFKPHGDAGLSTIVWYYEDKVGPLTEDEHAILAHNSALGEFDEVNDPSDQPSAADLGLEPDDFEFIPANQIAAAPNKAPAWLVKDMLPIDGTVFMFGAPGTAKSFLGIDLSMRVAMGTDFFGYKVKKQGTVAYIQAEGGPEMLEKRIKGWVKHFGPAPADARFLARAILMRDKSNIERLIKKLDSYGPLSMIVVDTMSQAMGGMDENSKAEAGEFMSLMKKFWARYRCLVLVIHHTGKDEARGLRGHSSLTGDNNGELYIQRDEDTAYGTITLKRVKEAEEGSVIDFKREVVTAFHYEDEDTGAIEAAKTLVLVPTAARSVRTRKPLAGSNNKKIFTLLDRVLTPFEGQGIKTSFLQKEWAKMLGETISDKNKRSLRNGLEAYKKAGVISISGDVVDYA